MSNEGGGRRLDVLLTGSDNGAKAMPASFKRGAGFGTEELDLCAKHDLSQKRRGCNRADDVSLGMRDVNQSLPIILLALDGNLLSDSKERIHVT